MGFRTVVVLLNDRAHEWTKDGSLGDKIFHAANGMPRELPYGTIVEQVHADTETLAVFSGYSGTPVAHTHWNRGQTAEIRNLALLKELADKMGYRISKKPVKKI